MLLLPLVLDELKTLTNVARRLPSNELRAALVQDVRALVKKYSPGMDSTGDTSFTEGSTTLQSSMSSLSASELKASNPQQSSDEIHWSPPPPTATRRNSKISSSNEPSTNSTKKESNNTEALGYSEKTKDLENNEGKSKTKQSSQNKTPSGSPSNRSPDSANGSSEMRSNNNNESKEEQKSRRTTSKGSCRETREDINTSSTSCNNDGKLLRDLIQEKRSNMKRETSWVMRAVVTPPRCRHSNNSNHRRGSFHSHHQQEEEVDYDDDDAYRMLAPETPRKPRRRRASSCSPARCRPTASFPLFETRYDNTTPQRTDSFGSRGSKNKSNQGTKKDTIMSPVKTTAKMQPVRNNRRDVIVIEDKALEQKKKMRSPSIGQPEQRRRRRKSFSVEDATGLPLSTSSPSAATTTKSSSSKQPVLSSPLTPKPQPKQQKIFPLDSKARRTRMDSTFLDAGATDDAPASPRHRRRSTSRGGACRGRSVSRRNNPRSSITENNNNNNNSNETSKVNESEDNRKSKMISPWDLERLATSVIISDKHTNRAEEPEKLSKELARHQNNQAQSNLLGYESPFYDHNVDQAKRDSSKGKSDDQNKSSFMEELVEIMG